MKITFHECVEGCVRHAAYAATCVIGLGMLAEWVMPGSVLPFVHIYWWAVGACVLLALSTRVAAERMNWAMALCASSVVASGVYVLLVDGRSAIPFTIVSFFVTLAILL